MGGTDFKDLFVQVMADDNTVRIRALSELGQNMINKQSKRFGKVLDTFLADGEFDVTGWNRVAIEVLVDVCSKQDRSFRFKKEGKMISIVRFPAGPMKDVLVSEIVNEPW